MNSVRRPCREAERHPALHRLKSFMRGELCRAEAAGVVRHLLTGCVECAAVTRTLWRLGEYPRALRVLLEEMEDLDSSADRRTGHVRTSRW